MSVFLIQNLLTQFSDFISTVGENKFAIVMSLQYLRLFDLILYKITIITISFLIILLWSWHQLMFDQPHPFYFRQFIPNQSLHVHLFRGSRQLWVIR